MKELMSKWGFVILFISAGGFGGMIIGLVKENKALSNDLAWYKTHRMTMNGSTGMRYDKSMHALNISKELTSYKLYSFDSGRIWYAIEYKQDSMFILGDVRKVYPGLLEAQQLIDKLTSKP